MGGTDALAHRTTRLTIRSLLLEAEQAVTPKSQTEAAAPGGWVRLLLSGVERAKSWTYGVDIFDLRTYLHLPPDILASGQWWPCREVPS